MEDIHVIKTFKELLSYRSTLPLGASVGFVPTMGNLHEGHLSLIDMSLSHARYTVVSIFVNPKQFSETEDLSTYPRSLDNDLELCAARFNAFRSKAACKGVNVNEEVIDTTTTVGDQANGDDVENKIIVFAPASVNEMYPKRFSTSVTVDVGDAKRNSRSEGAYRPHFFTGVATVLSRLFGSVRPTHVFFGQKDAQQCAVVNQLLTDIFPDVKLIVGPIIRDPEDGVALSSRNAYLTTEEREHATVLYKALKCGKEEFDKQKKSNEQNLEMQNVSEEIIRKHSQPTEKKTHKNVNVLDAHRIRNAVLREVRKDTNKSIVIEYVSICDRWTMEELEDSRYNSKNFINRSEENEEDDDDHSQERSSHEWILCIAGRVGSTRLIDNLLLA